MVNVTIYSIHGSYGNVLNNLRLFQYARFFDVADSTGKDRMKQLEKKTPWRKIRKASSTAALKLSSALNGGVNWGLDWSTFRLKTFAAWRSTALQYWQNDFEYSEMAIYQL